MIEGISAVTLVTPCDTHTVTENRFSFRGVKSGCDGVTPFRRNWFSISTFCEKVSHRHIHSKRRNMIAEYL